MAAFALGGLGAVGSVLGGLFAGSAAKKAAQIQADAAARVAADANKQAQTAGQGALSAAGDASNTVNTATGQSNDLLGGLYNSRMSDVQPYQRTGSDATAQLDAALPSLTQSFNPDMLAEDPGYQFRMEQGQKALQASAAAGGGAMGGAAAKAMARYGQDYSSNEYQNAFNRFQQSNAQKYNILSGTANQGLQANQEALNTTNSLAVPIANNGINAATYQGNADINANQYAGNALMQGSQIGGNAVMGGANAQAAGQVGSANALSKGITGAVDAGLGAYAIYKGYGRGGGRVIGNGSEYPGG